MRKTNTKLDEQIKKAEKEKLDAEQGAQRETQLAEDAQAKADKEREDADKAERKEADNRAAIAACDEQIAQYTTDQQVIEGSLDEQKRRYEALKRGEIQAERQQST